MARYTKQDQFTIGGQNTENEKIETAINDTLSRKGDSPNAMETTLDMNGNRIVNLPEPVSNTDALRKIDAEQYVTAAATSATEAQDSADSAAQSATEAASSAAVALNSSNISQGLVEELNSIYLGAFASDPTTDNDGQPLQRGALYYNTQELELYVFNGSAWLLAASQQSAINAASAAVAASNSAAAALVSQQSAALSETNAASSESAASLSESNAASSAQAASTSETNAALSATNASNSATAAQSFAGDAETSATNASTSETNAAASASAASASETNAASSATASASSASNAAASAAAALTSENNAATSETNAASSASAASTSAANALLSEQAADAAANAAEDARDEAVSYASAFSKGLIFIGVYDASSGVFPTLPDPLIGNPFWIISVEGTISGDVYNEGDTLIYDSANTSWIKLDTTDRVVSVAGKTGAVVLDKTDVGLDNVDNTSDLNKPISTATQTALDAKVDNSQLATAATANSVAQRTSDGSLNAVNVYASGNVGVGTSSPSAKLEVRNDVSAATDLDPTAIKLYNNSDGGSAIEFSNGVAGKSKISFGVTGTGGSTDDTYIGFSTGANTALSERMRIDSSGNVGIGTSSPAGKLDVVLGSDERLFFSTTGTAPSISSVNAANSAYDYLTINASDIRLAPNGTERMRIDSSGNVGIGTSSPFARAHLSSSVSVAYNPGSATVIPDGTGLRVDNTANLDNSYTGISFSATNNGGVASISYIGSLATSGSTGEIVFGQRISSTYTERMRIDSSGNVLAGADNTQTLGGASKRWSVVYAGTGIINTSDAREKTPVDELTPDELNAAKQLSKEIGVYKFLSAVAEKGDNARKHIGMTVQRAIEIMEANNLDPFAYGFICYDEWEEKTFEHPAVEAKEAEYDEEGNVISESVETQEAYTEVTQEAGNRYSFRPDEMLFFIARGLEARIEALES